MRVVAAVGVEARGAATDDGEVRPVEHEVVVALQRAPSALEHAGGHSDVAAADLAHEVTGLLRHRGALVDRRSVGEVHVLQHTDLLQQRQRPIHRRDVHAGEGVGQVLGRERVLLGVHGVEDLAPGPSDGVALGAQSLDDRVRIVEVAQMSPANGGHGRTITPPAAALRSAGVWIGDRCGQAGVMDSARTFKPRRRRLSPSRAATLHQAGPAYVLDEHGPQLDFREVFGREAPVVWEIGFGKGEATAAMAAAQPDRDVIAVEVHTPGVAALVEAIVRDGLTNLRVVQGDALVLLERLPLRSLTEIHVLFPDPWPKRRQGHRRLVRPDVVRSLVDRVRDGGALHLATDAPAYARQMAQVCDADPELSGGPVERPPWRPPTRFEEKAAEVGRPAIDLRYTVVRRQ